jgi:hypothetical protein
MNATMSTTKKAMKKDTKKTMKKGKLFNEKFYDMNTNREWVHNKFYDKKKALSSNRIISLFWDFYVLELLLSRAKKRGYFLSVSRIEKRLGIVTEKLLREQIKALEASVRGEVRYFFKICYFWNEEFDKEYECCVSPFLREVYKNKDPVSIPLSSVHAIFMKDIWATGYGGESWAAATKILIEAKKQLEIGCLNEMVIMVDRIFDLTHNSGFILSKTNFRILDKCTNKLRDGKFPWSHLDYRKKLKDVRKIPFCFLSSAVVDLCVANGLSDGVNCEIE